MPAGIEHNDQDGNNNQTTQTEQVQTVLTAGAEMLVVNLVNTSSDDAANGIIDKGKEDAVCSSTARFPTL